MNNENTKDTSIENQEMKDREAASAYLLGVAIYQLHASFEDSFIAGTNYARNESQREIDSLKVDISQLKVAIKATQEPDGNCNGNSSYNSQASWCCGCGKIHLIEDISKALSQERMESFHAGYESRNKKMEEILNDFKFYSQIVYDNWMELSEEDELKMKQIKAKYNI